MKKLIVVGSYYTFNHHDVRQLSKKFTRVDFIKPDELSKLLKKQDLVLQKHLLIVINLKQKSLKDLLPPDLTAKEVHFSHMHIQQFLEHFLNKCPLYHDGSLDNTLQPYTHAQYVIKRSIDFFGLFWLFFFSWPVILYSIYRIKKESPGSILFKQQRIGKDGKPFTCYKFRSMHENTTYHSPYTQENDPRLFNWGRTMRKYRLDELPQMFNVLKGDMHLVGPRAEWDKLVKEYQKSIDHYHKRHMVAPGITGWAQVNYPYGRGIEDAKQKLMYDLYYIKKWSLRLELKTILKTVTVVLGRKGV